MASPPCFPLLLLLAVFAACHARPLVEDVDGSMTTQPLQPSVISCSTAGNYSDGSPYHVNLYRLFSAIPMAVNFDGFFNGTFGVGGDEVFSLFMCYASDTDAECQDCLDRAPWGVMKLCPHSRTVRVVFESCTLGYSDESFFSVADLSVADSVGLSFVPQPGGPNNKNSAILRQVVQEPYRNWYDGVVLVEYVVDTARLSQTRLELIRRLTVNASQDAVQIAEGTKQFTDTQWVRAVVQCTRDLPPSECTRCLSYYTDQLPRMFPNNSGGAIKGSSCYLRYAVFAEKPRMVRLERHLYSDNYEERKNEYERETAVSGAATRVDDRQGSALPVSATFPSPSHPLSLLFSVSELATRTEGD